MHSDDQSALLARTAAPPFHKLIDAFPSSEIEIAYAKIRPLGDVECIFKCGKESFVDIIEDTWHGAWGLLPDYFPLDT